MSENTRPKNVDWGRTLKSVMYTHQDDDLTISMGDISSLVDYIDRLKNDIDDLKVAKNQAIEESARLRTEMLATALKLAPKQGVSDYYKYK